MFRIIFGVLIVSGLIWLGSLWLLSAGAPQKAKEQAKLDQPISAEESQVIKGNNEFAFDLYRQLSKTEEGNLVFSPFSISTALAMTYAGARGETAEQMEKTLHYPLGQEHFHPAMGGVIRRLEGYGTPDLQLDVANALWGLKNSCLPVFLSLTRQHYGASFKEADFQEPENARRIINAWVEQQTREKIKELLRKGDVSQATRLVLTNAIYFKGLWELPFKKAETKEEAFDVSPSHSVNVQMMNQLEEKEYKYYANEEFQYLELPYKGHDLSMVILLPAKKGKLAELEGALTAAKLDENLSRLHKAMGTVALPRFRGKTHVELKKELIELGMPLPFSEDADFSGIDGDHDLHIQAVIHEAFIDVSEEGTEAAAATAVVMDILAPPTFAFRANHPFLYLIMNRHSKELLFFGRVSNPVTE